MMGDDMMGDGMMPEDGEGGKTSTGLIVGGVSGAVAVAAAGLGVFLKLRKKKKAALLEAQELAELEKDL